MDTRKVLGQTFYREMKLAKNAVDEKMRQVQVSFSSENETIERAFGIEILDHSKNSVQLDRLNTGAPVLMNHLVSEHVGVVESAHIDTKDRKGRAVLRFGKNHRAQEVFSDIQDNIIRNVSVGYLINEMVREHTADEKRDVYRVTSWTPLEISLVSVPADTSVGVGRNYQQKGHKMRNDEPQILTKQEQAEEDAFLRKGKDEWDAGERERYRSTEILGLGKLHPDKRKGQDMAEQAIRAGMSLNKFHKIMLEEMSNVQPLNLSSGLDLSQRDMKQYSLMKVVRAQLSGQYDGCGLEMEVSRSLEQKLGKRASGMLVPMEFLFKRIIEKGGGALGVGLIGTEHRPDLYIDTLKPLSQVVALGATVLPNLTGDVSIPKKVSDSTGTWVTEGNEPSESTPDYSGTVTLSPKSVTAWSRCTRKMILQSSPAVEGLMIDDLNSSLGSGIDMACINGSGIGAEPLGLMGQQGLEIIELGAQGGAATWAKIVALETAVGAANADINAMAYLTNSKGRGALKTVEKATGTGLFIWTDSTERGFGSVNGYRSATSNHVPSDLTKATNGTALSAVIFGDWSSLLLGKWSGAMDIIVNPYLESKKGNLIINGFVDCDVAFRHIQSFAAIVDMTT